MATQLGQFNKDTYVQLTDSNGVITDLKFKTAGKNTVTAGYDNTKVTFKNGSNSLSVEAALSAGTCTGNAATASKLLTGGITDLSGTNSDIAASQKLATDISSAVLPKIDEALTNYTAYELDGKTILLKNMKLVKYQAIYEDKTADLFDFYVFKPIAIA